MLKSEEFDSLKQAQKQNRIKKTAIFIPGRLNSERLRSKLIRPFDETGNSLWHIALHKVNEISSFFPIFVLATGKLLEIAKGIVENQELLISRDPETCNTDGPLKYIFKDIRVIGDREPDVTHVMFLNPCLLFLKTETIMRAVSHFNRTNDDYSTSVKPLQNWVFDESGNSVNNIDYKRLSTKEIVPFYQAAHAFHIFNLANFFEDGMMLRENHGVISLPKEELIDVDTELDFEIAKVHYKKTKGFAEKKNRVHGSAANSRSHFDGIQFSDEISEDWIVENIQKLYGYYLHNLKVMSDFMDVSFVNILTDIYDKNNSIKGVEERDSWVVCKDPFLQNSVDDNLKLGRKILKNGTYWHIKLARDEKGLFVSDGIHRISACRRLMQTGEWPKDHKMLAIIHSVGPVPSSPVFDPGVVMPHLVIPTRKLLKRGFVEAYRHLFDAIERAPSTVKVYSQTGEFVSLQLPPHGIHGGMLCLAMYTILLRNPIFEYKKLTGKDFLGAPEINDERAWNAYEVGNWKELEDWKL